MKDHIEFLDQPGAQFHWMLQLLNKELSRIFCHKLLYSYSVYEVWEGKWVRQNWYTPCLANAMVGRFSETPNRKDVYYRGLTWMPDVYKSWGDRRKAKQHRLRAFGQGS